MSTRAFAALRRHAAEGVSRRTSLLTLGGAALAATVAKPDVSEAKKKKGQDCKKKAKQRCANDAAACRAQIPAACADDPNCTGLATFCCEACSGNGFITCLLAASPGAAARLK
jgi:type IV secretory pathway VirD2 relaxase